MSLWVVAYCTKPLGEAFADELESALDAADFASMAEWVGLEEEDGYEAEESLRYERREAMGRRFWLVHYRHHVKGDRSMRCDHHVDPDFVKSDVASQLEQEPPAAVRKRLPSTVETVAFDLKTSDWEGMGMPIAHYIAMHLAGPKLGDGLVQMEEEWWDPRTHKQVE
jgi:hypothetical protein